MELVLKISKFAEKPKATVKLNSTFADYSAAIESNSGYAPIIDDDKFVGILTDGDIRRYISKNGPINLLEIPAASIGNFHAKTIDSREINSYIRESLTDGSANDYNIKHLPVLDTNNKIMFVIIKHRLLASIPRSLYSVETINDLQN